MLRVPILLLIASATAAHAADKWLEFRSGPFTVLTTAGENPGREVLNELEQLRHVLGHLLGVQDMKSLWPFRILLLKQSKTVAPAFPEPALARDTYVASMYSLEPATKAAVARILIEANTARMPPGIESGLVHLFSTFEAEGTRLTLGALPARQDREWARVHMLSTDPRFSGKLGVLLRNLQQGVEPEPAYKNAFEMTPVQIESEVDKYIKAGAYTPSNPSARPLNPRRELNWREPDPKLVELTQLDLRAASGEKSAVLLYSDHPGALDTAVPILDRAKAEKDRTKAKALFQEAAKANPAWAEPLWLEAQIEDNPARRIHLMKQATQLAPRRTDWWLSLAAAQESAGLFSDAVKTWGAAERSTATPEERAAIRQSRLAGEEKRQEKLREEKEAARRAAAAEIEALRQKMLENIRTAEAKANAGKSPLDPNVKLDEYREDMGYGKVSGRLTRVQCGAGRIILYIAAESGQSIKLLVPKADALVVTGKDNSLACGAQTPALNIHAEYIEKQDAKLGTAGEAQTVEIL